MLLCTDRIAIDITCTAGHEAFLGFVYLDYTYNNAVVHVFINLLRTSVRLNHTSQVSMQNVLSNEEGNTGHRSLSYLKTGKLLALSIHDLYKL